MSSHPIKDLTSNKVEIPKRMPIIGILTGISHQTGADYYIQINEKIQKALPYKYTGYTPKMMLYSLNLEEYVELLTLKKYDKVNELLIDGILRLYRGGCDYCVLASNTAHKCYDQIKQFMPYFPILHIGDCIAHEILKHKFNKVGLIGTIYTMNEDFLKGYLLKKYGIQCVVPSQKHHAFIGNMINFELSSNILSDQTRQYLVETIIQNDLLSNNRIQGLILGCTEIGLLVQQSHIPNIPIFDSAKIHIQCIVEIQLNRKNVWDFASQNDKIHCRL